MAFLVALALVSSLIVAAAAAGQLAPAWVLHVLVPYLAASCFLVGIAWRVLVWAAAPVRFPIATTCGQQRSVAGVPSARLESPSTGLGVAGRMALEILLFRSLFRNTRAESHPGPRLAFAEEKLLWLAALAFHWSLLVIAVRHLRFVLDPVPAFVTALSARDRFFEIGMPALYLTDAVVLAALAVLLLRRLAAPWLRYISLAADYVPLLLLLVIATTGLLMRHALRVDLVSVKQLALGLAMFSPGAALPGPGAGMSAILFHVHLAAAAALVAWLPFSKLVHMGGVFLSPTRNLATDSRRRRHDGGLARPASARTYAAWEAEFREQIRAAGLPLDEESERV